MKKLLFLTTIFLLVITISSCFNQKITSPRYDESKILETQINKSQDNSTSSLSIKIVDIETGESIPWATIVLIIGQERTQYESDFNGSLIIPNIENGLYSLRKSFVGFKTLKIDTLTINKKEDVMIKIGLLNVGGLSS